MHAISITTLVGIVAFVVAKPHPLPKPLPQNAQAGPVFGHPGVATFNNYLRQKTSTCFPGGIRKFILSLTLISFDPACFRIAGTLKANT